MSHNESDPTQASLFENVRFVDFGQGGRHRTDSQNNLSDLYDGGDLPTYSQVQRDLEGVPADPGLTVVTYSSEDAARREGMHDLEAFWAERSAYGAQLRARRGQNSRFPGGDDIAPVTFLPGVKNPRDLTPPDDAS